MSWYDLQIDPPHAPRSPERHFALSASLPPLSGAGSAERSHFRLDLRRSLLMHCRLALGFTLFGLFLAVVYLLSLWVVNTARSLVYIPPTPSDIIHNATSLLLGFAFLGAAAAIVAHKSDPRVYIASDVERLMGVAPMAQLPDFSEVSDEVAKEHLMRSVARIDAAFRDGRVRNCVFTGTGTGAGATTVALRVKETLETLGRVAVVMDGTGAPLHPAVGEAEDLSAEIILTDTPPLIASAATEYLARHADCTIVVIESGVTTRAQLRTIASVLECLHVRLVGFVLNRVRLAKADEAFRRSLEETKRNLRYEKPSADRQTLEILHFAVESGRGSLEPESMATAQKAASSPAEITSIADPVNELDPAVATETIPKAELGAGAGLQKPEPAHSGMVQHDEIPWWLREPRARANAAHTQPRMSRAGGRQEVSSRPNGSESGHEAAQPTLEEPSRVTPPPLSELRGTFFSAGLKELDVERRPVQQSAEVELLMRAITPFEPLFNHAEPKQSSGPSYTPEVEAEHTAATHTLIPIAGSEIAPAAADEADTHSNGSRHVAKQRESRSSKSVAPESNGTRRGGNGDQARRGQNHAIHEQGDVLDDVQILPSKRGQYKKNGWEHRNGQR